MGAQSSCTITMASVLAKSGLISAVALIGEKFLLSKIGSVFITESVSLQIPRLYSAVIAVNVVASSFVLVTLAFRVGSARKQFIEEAKKKDDREAEARYSYPKLYAEGFSEESKRFNCIQRGHQQALETYTTFVASSLVGGLRHPVVTSLAGVLWCASRLSWADGYATGAPDKRYSRFLSSHIWTSTFVVLAAAASTSAQLIGLW
eukprot:c8894_g1_i1.p1 GENE.c8894_g1_i1~~c8894_g1_i1.p1  ORF type:complete len:205 (-),score=50.11 c8894_g1_i1:27-641(-)